MARCSELLTFSAGIQSRKFWAVRTADASSSLFRGSIGSGSLFVTGFTASSVALDGTVAIGSGATEFVGVGVSARLVHAASLNINRPTSPIRNHRRSVLAGSRSEIIKQPILVRESTNCEAAIMEDRESHATFADHLFSRRVTTMSHPTEPRTVKRGRPVRLSGPPQRLRVDPIANGSEYAVLLPDPQTP